MARRRGPAVGLNGRRGVDDGKRDKEGSGQGRVDGVVRRYLAMLGSWHSGARILVIADQIHRSAAQRNH